jgi:hypothetical protein
VDVVRERLFVNITAFDIKYVVFFKGKVRINAADARIVKYFRTKKISELILYTIVL